MTESKPKEITILMADDDPEDRMFASDALRESRLVNDFRTVEDGEELMEYLRRSGRYARPAEAPRPGLILLDLKMPRKDGFEALEEIKADPELRKIPVVILTSSEEEQDIVQSYELGVSGFVSKPVTFRGLVDTLSGIGRYWLQVVELPPGGDDE